MSFSVTLVGARGRMGAMFREVWSARHPVHVVNRTRDASDRALYLEADLAAGIGTGEVVVLCVPAPAFPQTLAAIVPHMRAGQILSDVCSVKVNPMRWMQEAYPGPVVGTHPLFGPENFRPKSRVALVRGTKATGDHLERVAVLFREMECELFTTTAEDHDRAVAITQSLHFAMSAGYFSLAARHQGLERYLTPSFCRFLDAAKSELTEGEAMFRDFTATNPLFPEILAAYRDKLREIEAGNLESLTAEARLWYAESPSDGK